MLAKLNELRPGRPAGVNARMGSGDVAALANSISHHGLLQPLAVAGPVDDGGYVVVDGNRRLAALRQLMADKAIEMDHPVEVVLMPSLDVARLLEMSLAANIEHLPMHPVDIYTTVSRLVDDGAKQHEIAARFGLTAKQVKQHLALGRIAPPILEAWRDQIVTESQARAFTISDNHAEQIAVFEELRKPNRYMQEWEIRKALTHDARDMAREIHFLGGVAAVKALGVTFIEDLFGNGRYVANPEVLVGALQDRMNAKRDELLAAGWKWVLQNHEISDRLWRMDRILVEPVYTAAEDAQMKVLEASQSDSVDPPGMLEIKTAATLRAFSPEDRARSGCIILLGVHPGEIYVYAGYIHPDDNTPANKPDSDKPPPPIDPGPASKESKALINTLRDMKTEGLAQAVAMSSRRDVMTFTVAALAAQSFRDSPIRLSSDGMSKISRSDAMDSLFQLPSSVTDFASALKWAQSLSDPHMAAALAGLVAQAIDVTTHAVKAKGVRFGAITALMDFLDPEILDQRMQAVFRWGAYLESASPKDLLQALEDVWGPAMRRQCKGMALPELIQLCRENLLDSGWLPVELRTPGYDPPKGPTIEPERAEEE